MGTEALRPHGSVRSYLPVDKLWSSPPVKPGGSGSRTRLVRTTPRQITGASSNGAGASPSGRSPPPQAKPFRRGSNNGGNGANPRRSGRRTRIPESQGQMVVKAPVKNLVMEKVTILKRGEEVKPKQQREDSRPSEDPRPSEDRRPSDREEKVAEETSSDGLALCSTDLLGPCPKILPKQARLVDQKSTPYAGSGFFMSPSPRSLPLPTSFFAKKEVANATDLATIGLRYLLRLDLP